MNIEAYDLDSLRKIIRGLQEENRILKEQLRQAGAAYTEQDYFSDKIEEYEDYDPDQGARIYRPFIKREHAQAFFKMFWGRQDVYAKRGRRGGYFPQCANRWNNYVYVNGVEVSNSVLRERFGISDANKAMASRIIKDTLGAGKIKLADPQAAVKMRRYIPYWA